jgi:hypothetical protein
VIDTMRGIFLQLNNLVGMPRLYYLIESWRRFRHRPRRLMERVVINLRVLLIVTSEAKRTSGAPRLSRLTARE